MPYNSVLHNSPLKHNALSKPLGLTFSIQKND